MVMESLVLRSGYLTARIMGPARPKGVTNSRNIEKKPERGRHRGAGRLEP
jgi:hypothetical protein